MWSLFFHHFLSFSQQYIAILAILTACTIYFQDYAIVYPILILDACVCFSSHNVNNTSRVLYSGHHNTGPQKALETGTKRSIIWIPSVLFSELKISSRCLFWNVSFMHVLTIYFLWKKVGQKCLLKIGAFSTKKKSVSFVSLRDSVSALCQTNIWTN